MQKQVERSFFFTLYIYRAYSTPQILMVESGEPLAKYFPSGLQQTEDTIFECPFKVRMHCPLFASHILTVLSYEPLAKYFPSGLQQTDSTSSECPCNVCRYSNVVCACAENVPKFTNKVVKTAVKAKILFSFILTILIFLLPRPKGVSNYFSFVSKS